MDDQIAFLLDAAEQLRELARGAPEVADALRRLADDVEATATKLRYRRKSGERADH